MKELTALFSAFSLPQVQEGFTWLLTELDRLDRLDDNRDNFVKLNEQLTRLYQQGQLTREQYLGALAILTQPQVTSNDRDKLNAIIRR